jgi:hypothetical protein
MELCALALLRKRISFVVNGVFAQIFPRFCARKRRWNTRDMRDSHG